MDIAIFWVLSARLQTSVQLVCGVYLTPSVLLQPAYTHRKWKKIKKHEHFHSLKPPNFSWVCSQINLELFKCIWGLQTEFTFVTISEAGDCNFFFFSYKLKTPLEKAVSSCSIQICPVWTILSLSVPYLQPLPKAIMLILLLPMTFSSWGNDIFLLGQFPPSSWEWSEH